MDTEVDAKPENLNKKTFSADERDKERRKVNLEYLQSDYYDMSGDNYLIVLNHYEYKKTIYFNYKTPPKRGGTMVDVKALEEVFGDFLRFKVIVHHNFDYEDIKAALKDFCKRDHTNTTCVSVAVMTHGEQDGSVYAADRPYLLSDVINLFDGVDSLLLKPKLFFVQACRGEELDSGRTLQLDAQQKTYKLPSRADFLVLYSTMEGFVAFRDQYGSWLLQTLCNLIREHYRNLDLLHIITLLNREIALERESNNTRIRHIHGKKQMPETCFSLTKLLKFE